GQRGHGSQHVLEELRAEVSEAVVLLARGPMPARAVRTRPDGQPRGLVRFAEVNVANSRVARFVDRDLPQLVGRVLEVDDGAGLDGTHGGEDVGAVERLTPVVVG